MTAREGATLWLIGIAAIAIVIWDHRNSLNTIMASLSGSPGQVIPSDIQVSQTANLTTNSAIPMAGNEFGALATRGGLIDGATQPNGLDKVFGNIWDNLVNG
jgi:hypothetical protein